MMRNTSTALVIGLAVVCAVPALANSNVATLITEADKKRLDEHNATRQQALAEAHNGDAADVAVLDEVIAKPFLSFRDFTMSGDWQCRTIKAGGLSALVVYGWFKCRLADDGSGLTLEKLTGSQRTAGRFFFDDNKRLIYLGTGFVAGDSVNPYGAGPEFDQAGYAFRTGLREWRIEFPAPYYESKLDIIEFKR